MNYGVTYSLRIALESNIPEITKAQIISDGTDLNNLSKPFLTIDYLDETPALMAAGRTSYWDTYRYQVGVFARTISERHTLETKVREVIRRPEGHPLYRFNEETGIFVDTGELTPFEDNGFTPITSDDSSDSTTNHRGYFEVDIEIY